MSKPNKQKNILNITKNPSFTETINERIDHNTYVITTASDYNSAISIIEDSQIDLIITCLPTAADNNFSLLSSLDNAKSNIPVIVYAHKIPAADADTLDSFAAFNFISDTLDQEVLQKHIETSLDKGTKGHISGVSLASFLQLIELDRKTCTLRIKYLQERGVLYFQEGEIIDAVSGRLRGEKAALEIVGWAPVEIDIWENCRKTAQNIDSPLGFLLIEGTRLSDERKQQNQQQSAHAPKEEDKKPEQEDKKTTPPPAVIPEAEQKILDHLLTAVENHHIKSLFIAKADGTTMTEKDCPSFQSQLIKKSVGSAINLAESFNYQHPRQIIIDIGSESRLLILIGPGAFVGMELPKDLAPTIISGDLTPIIKRLHFS